MIKQFYLIHIDETQTGTTTLEQSRLRSNDNEGVFHISQSSNIGASPLDGLVSYPRVFLLCRDALGIFYSTSYLR